MKEAFYAQLPIELFGALEPGMMLHHTISGVKLLVLSEYSMRTSRPVASRIFRALDENGISVICGVETALYETHWQLL
jgi:hypothetical protein